MCRGEVEPVRARLKSVEARWRAAGGRVDGLDEGEVVEGCVDGCVGGGLDKAAEAAD